MIHETYRPRTFEDVLGNPRAVRALRSQCDRGLGGSAIWLSGASGTGKTTLAKIAARTLADELFIEECAAPRFNQAALDCFERTRSLYALGKGGRVWIINEAHGLRAPIIQQFHDLLEPLPRHVAVIFTTTNEGQAKLFDGIEASPLVSRCTPIPLTNQGLCPLFAARFCEVAALEGFEIPLSKARRLVQDNHNNLRACYEWLGSPEALEWQAQTAAVEAA